MKERVLMVGIYTTASGVASLYGGKPHYFDCEFDHERGDYTDVFRLWPIGTNLLQLATEQWQIYRA